MFADAFAEAMGYINLDFGIPFDYKKVTELHLHMSKQLFDTTLICTGSISIPLTSPSKDNEWHYVFNDIINEFEKLDVSLDTLSVLAVIPMIQYNNITFFAPPSYAKLNFHDETIVLIDEKEYLKKKSNNDS